MARNWSWLKENIEPLVALTLAITVSLLGIVDVVSVELVNKAIPLTLAVFAFALLRDRWRRDASDRDVKATLGASSVTLQKVSAQLEQVNALNSLVVQAQRSLDEVSTVRVLTGPAISEALAEARHRTDRWSFRGGTGTFTRIVTLPECVDKARRDRRSLAFRLEILDPRDIDLCEEYARLYRSLSEDPSAREQAWDGDGTRREIYATILAACWHKEMYGPLSMEIGLSKVISTFRWDLSSRSLVITQRGPRFPAMVIDSGRYYYDCWSTELQTSFEQCPKVPLELARRVPLGVRPEPADVRRLFAVLDLQLPKEYTDADVSKIVEKALYDRDPYTRGAGDSGAVA
ncbi:hypothetical protein AB0B74_04770 [Micromonospora parva]|uniref:hypothetical protein n=1 Tax=Micromonospora parva TaxID=1464048 RepID=UPI0024A423CB|nr:hypothetical protein Misp05_02020 [Micromonospora sp. NBRC 107095]